MPEHEPALSQGVQRRPAFGLFLALPLLTFSGFFMSWGGAVRWKDCWLVAPSRCETHDDMYGVTPSTCSARTVTTQCS